MLQPKLNLKVSQRQALTPGLVQMVSVLALNKLELKEMINTEMVENPVLEELEESATTLDERAGQEGDRERSAEETVAESERPEKDPFDEIDFGSYFQDYLDPGFRTTSNFEEYDKPSFENFLSQPSTLTDHLAWQLGALTLTPMVKGAAELIIGNLNEDGYLTASDEELVEALLAGGRQMRSEPIPFERGASERGTQERERGLAMAETVAEQWPTEARNGALAQQGVVAMAAGAESDAHGGADIGGAEQRAELLALIASAREVVNQLDPVGIGARDLRECLLLQIHAQERDAALLAKRRQDEHAAELEAELAGGDAPVGERAGFAEHQAPERNGSAPGGPGLCGIAAHIVSNCLAMLQKKDMRELTRSCGQSAEAVQAAVDLIRTLDPRPGQRYNQSETRLIEPDVAFVKRDGVYVVVMNEEDMPTLRLNQGYRKMLRQKQTEKDVREYVKERYKSAIQLLRNIEQRKNTIVRTCEVIVRRQAEFLEHGEQALRPMMIKDVAEEIGVHPSTVSRAVANKYVHTTQGVYELRFFFTEGVNGPEGGDMPLVLLKRKVKKLIEEEDARKPLTDDQLAAELQRQGIQVTRRTVAKYREDMQIPSTHQRRVR
ncbi:MAG TPA: RNA polymerase factor sigma-54 [Granulicella sp.]|nr:RNA polymerase factor sigma-54 [Granulicella sp.]